MTPIQQELAFRVRAAGFTGATNLLFAENGNSEELLTVLDNGSWIFNEGGLSTADIRMEGDTVSNLFFLDASAG